jgi:hypothetical protein
VNDIKFDIVTREIVMQNNDFALQSNPSVQNGGIALYSRADNLRFPMFGIGAEDMINSDMTKVAYEMNRWKVMVSNDGATIARWSAAPMVSIEGGNDVAIQTEISYL